MVRLLQASVYFSLTRVNRINGDCILKLYDLYTTTLTQSSNIQSLHSQEYVKFRQVLQFCWFRIMKELQGLKLCPADKLYSFHTRWRIIGHRLGIRGNAQPPKNPDDNETNNIVCCWSDCLCHRANPCRHRLRICKGCCIVRYCSKWCQEL